MLMDGETILEVDRLSKIYSRHRAATRRRLAALFARSVTGLRFDNGASLAKADEFYAVKDASFTLRRGQTFGIIGLNGSGKTTLLRMLAGQILPDAGQITILGTSASMIDLTAGFQPTASGRDNVFLRGAAMGKSRGEMEAIYHEIVEFSELGDAITAPVATYSSGMLMRLAFSIVTMSTPDIFFIDEILAVGDFAFKQKCLARIRELRERSAFVMVSHSMPDVERFCSRAMVLHKGIVVFEGPAKDATDYYINHIESPQVPHKERVVAKALHPQFINEKLIKSLECAWIDDKGSVVESIQAGHSLGLRVSFTTAIKIDGITVGVPVWNDKGEYATGFSTDRMSKRFNVVAGERNVFVLRIPAFCFNDGVYHANITVLSGSEFLVRRSIDPIEVKQSPRPHWGMVDLPYSWSQNVDEPMAAA